MTFLSIEGVRRSYWRNDLYQVSLVDETGSRLLNITIGQQEAYVIVMALNHISAPRPMTLHFMASALEATHVILEEARIEDLPVPQQPFFYATVRLRNGDTVQTLDARPSDALGLAVLLGAPISASERLLEEVGVIIQEGQTPELVYVGQLFKQERIVLPEGKKLRLGYSKTPARDAMVKEVKTFMLGVPWSSYDVDLEQAKSNYLAFLLGDDFQHYRQR